MSMLGGCVDNDQSLVNMGWVGPDTTSATGCLYDTASPFLNRGTYDVTLADKLQDSTAYRGSLKIMNNLLSRTGAPIETQGLTIRSFDVQVIPHGPVQAVVDSSFQANELDFSYEVPSTYLAPQLAGFFQIQAIAGTHVAALAGLSGQAPSSFTLRARPVYTRGEEQHAGAYSELPIDICFGCLSGGTPKEEYPACSSFAGATPLNGNLCNPAADVSVTCCQPENGGIICGMGVMAASMAK